MTLKIRRIRPDDWRRVRSLRLAALADAPSAFGSTLALEQAYPDEVWRERALGASTGSARATFLAERGGHLLGMATGLADPPEAAEGGVRLVAMFVAAGARREGVGIALIEAVVAWARDCGASRIALSVTSGNDPAAALYRRCGFAFTGLSKPHAHVPGLVELDMARRI